MAKESNRESRARGKSDRPNHSHKCDWCNPRYGTWEQSRWDLRRKPRTSKRDWEGNSND